MAKKKFTRFAPLFRSRFGLAPCCGREDTFPMSKLTEVKEVLATEYVGYDIIIYGFNRGEAFDDPPLYRFSVEDESRYLESYTVPGEKKW